MTQLSFPLPELGQASKFEDPRTLAGFTEIIAWANGNIGTVNLDSTLKPIFESAWTSYTPTWKASLTEPSLGNGTLVGAYQKIGKTCFFGILLKVGSTTTGGTGGYSFALPATAVSNLEQNVTAKALTSDAKSWAGVGLIQESATTVLPLLPKSPTTCYLETAQNANVTAAKGTGIPQVAGEYSYTNTSRIAITGLYTTV